MYVSSSAPLPNCVIMAISPFEASSASSSATFSARSAASVAFTESDHVMPERAKFVAISAAFSKVCPKFCANS